MLRALIDFTLSNARRFYSSMGNLLDGKGLRLPAIIGIMRMLTYVFPILIAARYRTAILFPQLFPTLQNSAILGRFFFSFLFQYGGFIAFEAEVL